MKKRKKNMLRTRRTKANFSDHFFFVLLLSTSGKKEAKLKHYFTMHFSVLILLSFFQ